jgi:PAS domain S-box-containing protein
MPPAVYARAMLPTGQGRTVRPDATHIAAIVDSAMDAIISIDDAHRVVLFNPAAERMFGVTADAAIGTNIERFLPVRYREAHRAHVSSFADTNVTRRAMGALRPLMAIRADGSEFPIEASISQVATPAGHTLTVILRDVSERVRAEEMLTGYTRELEQSRADLRALSAKLRDMRETERAHIAREVHDRLGQSLTALSLGLERLYQDLEHAGPTAIALARRESKSLAALVQDAIKRTRRLASELHPAVLDHLGLAAAVEWQVQDFATRTGLVCHVDVDAALEVPRDVELPFFRVLQEALTNIVRHAEARTAIVALRIEDQGLQLVVEDDGRGVMEKSAQSPGLGLVGMRERLVDFGGIVTITDRPAVNGARLIARVPWPVTRLEVR